MVGDIVVQSLRQPHLEILEEQFATEWHALHEHVHVHQAQSFAVHLESFAADWRQVVLPLHVPQPQDDLISGPAARI